MEELPIQGIVLARDSVDADQVDGQNRALEALTMGWAGAADSREKTGVWTDVEVFRRQLGRDRGGEFPESFTMLDVGVEIFRRVGIERRRQNAAIAERPRAELHEA